MNHEIDLSKINTRTDLAIELFKDKEIKEQEIDNIKITTMNVTEEDEKKIGKKRGNYITIEFEDVTDHANKEKVEKVLINELKKMYDIQKIKDNDTVLVIGLGNDKSTPDSLGPLTINNILVTRHLFEMDINVEEGYRCVSALNTGVTGETGIETSDIIFSIVDKIKPSFLIVIDALKASNINKLNRVIQISDSGISPGSGIGNNRKEISYETLGIPVISIGVPTVVDAVTIVSDSFDYITKDYTYEIDNMNNPKQKLVVNPNLSKEDIREDTNHKKQLFGLVGSLKDDDLKKLIDEVLSHRGYNLIVSEIEMDFLINKLSNILSNAINNSLHKNKV